MIRLKGLLFKRWKLEGNEGSQAHSKGNEGSMGVFKMRQG
jgi:hypothetical protein